MAGILFDNVQKRYGKSKEFAVRNFKLKVEDGEFLVLVGPSGCGKSTSLRMLAGLEDVTSGDIYIGERRVNDVPPRDRDISMVFQNYALYPNMTIFENIAFGLRLRKLPKHEIEERVKRTARMLEIEGLLGRRPRELSGGQRQRAALGRAIVRTPQVFLMDEPLSNLDAKLRVQMRAEMIALHKKLGVTTIYVTHDQVEAMTMGDRIVVMNRGEIQQADTPENVYSKPANRFVAGFIGTPPMNFIEGRLGEEDGLVFHTRSFALKLTKTQSAELLRKGYAGRAVTLGIRPEFVRVARGGEGAGAGGVAQWSAGSGAREDAGGGWPEINGVLVFSEFIGSDRHFHVDIRGDGLFTARADALFRAKEGEPLRLRLDMRRALFFDRDGGQLLNEAGEELL